MWWYWGWNLYQARSLTLYTLSRSCSWFGINIRLCVFRYFLLLPVFFLTPKFSYVIPQWYELKFMSWLLENNISALFHGINLVYGSALCSRSWKLWSNQRASKTLTSFEDYILLLSWKLTALRWFKPLSLMSFSSIGLLTVLASTKLHSWFSVYLPWLWIF